MTVPEFHASDVNKKNRRRPPRRLWLSFVSAFLFIAIGYFVHEWEDNSWSLSGGIISIKNRVVAIGDWIERHLSVRKESASTTVLTTKKSAPAVMIDRQEEMRLGDENYLCARQLSQKIPLATVLDRPRIIGQVIEELQLALVHYEAAQSGSAAETTDPVLRDKITAVRRAIFELEKQTTR